MAQVPQKPKSSNGLRDDVLNAVENLFDNSKVQKFEIQVEKNTGVVSIHAKTGDGRSSSTEILAPGLATTISSNVGSPQSFDQKVIALHDKNVNLSTGPT